MERGAVMKLEINKLTVNDMVRGDLLVKEASHKDATNGRYAHMVLTDGESDIVAKRWKYDRDLPIVGQVYQVVGTVGSWQGKTDISLKGWVPGETPVEEFLKHGPKSIAWLYAQLQMQVTSLTDVDYYTLCDHILKHYEAQIMKAPAAKTVHHAYIGGWLQHTYEVCRGATALGYAMEGSADMKLNHDLILAAALLHDVGKLYNYTETSGVIDLSDDGHLTEHIVAGSHLILNWCEALQIPLAKTRLINHCIVSHHGEIAYGSPVVPTMPEAYLVYLADQASARCTMMEDAIKDCKGDWTPKIFFLGTSVFAGNKFPESNQDDLPFKSHDALPVYTSGVRVSAMEDCEEQKKEDEELPFK